MNALACIRDSWVPVASAADAATESLQMQLAGFVAPPLAEHGGLTALCETPQISPVSRREEILTPNHFHGRNAGPGPPPASELAARRFLCPLPKFMTRQRRHGLKTIRN